MLFTVNINGTSIPDLYMFRFLFRLLFSFTISLLGDHKLVPGRLILYIQIKPNLTVYFRPYETKGSGKPNLTV